MRSTSWGLLVLLVCACGKVNSSAPDAASIDANVPPDAQLCVPLNCDDNDPCTQDACGATGCTHMPIPPTPGSQELDYTGGLQAFTVPSCVTSLHVDAYGASGGNAGAYIGGRGAEVVATVTVTSAETIGVLVGGAGSDATNTTDQSGASGGGGTFVVDASSNPLVVAGGGGGGYFYGSYNNEGANGDDGQAGPDGTAGSGATGGAGGTGGGGGTTGSNSGGWHVGTAGGGYSGDGNGVSDGSTGYGPPNTPGLSYLDGGAGGTVGTAVGARNGGYGGGGAAGFTGAGGGGYSGGGSGGFTGAAPEGKGGGGGSISSDSAAVITAGVNVGNGKVIFSW